MKRRNLIFKAWCNAELGPAFTFPKWWIHLYGQEGADPRSDTVRHVNSEEKLVIWNKCCAEIVAVSGTFSTFLREHETEVCFCEWMFLWVNEWLFLSSLQTTCCCYVKMNICTVVTRLNVCTKHSAFYLIQIRSFFETVKWKNCPKQLLDSWVKLE